MKELHFFADAVAVRYGQKCQRIPIDLALGCPNRVGGFGDGCIFCAENGSRARHLARSLDLPAQVAQGVRYARERYGAQAPYIAYFQAFTSTFAPVERLRALYETVLREADFRMVIIGTRPDALPPETVDFLAELAQRYELWIELGVQSMHDRTLELIRRGHTAAATVECARRLHAAGLHTACHVILGLPGESTDDELETARRLADLPFEAVKLHQLMVLKKTALARWYAEPAGHPAIVPLNEYEYAARAKAFLRELPDHWQIMRLEADAEPEALIAPHWWMTKSGFLEFFRKEFAAGAEEDFPGVPTADGSYTLYHPEFRQPFHSLAGADAEALHKFVEPTALAERLKRGDVRLLDLGFGLGGNTMAAIRCAEATRAGRLEITSLELDLRTLRAAGVLHRPGTPERDMLGALAATGEYRTDFARVVLTAGDARQTLPRLGGMFDVVFHDGFSPDCNPELWTLDLLREIRRRLKPDGIVASYSSAYPFRGALLKLGFEVGESAPFGRKRGGTLATFTPPALPLAEKERGIILQSTAGVPYRDAGLCRSREEIFRRREATVAALRRRGVPKWFREKTQSAPFSH